MPTRGGDRGGRRPLKTKGDPRLALNCRVRASNHHWLKEKAKLAGLSIGELTDLAIEALKRQPEILLPSPQAEE